LSLSQRGFNSCRLHQYFLSKGFFTTEKAKSAKESAITLFGFQRAGGSRLCREQPTNQIRQSLNPQSLKYSNSKILEFFIANTGQIQ
jgi:hypothetical protein